MVKMLMLWTSYKMYIKNHTFHIIFHIIQCFLDLIRNPQYTGTVKCILLTFA